MTNNQPLTMKPGDVDLFVAAVRDAVPHWITEGGTYFEVYTGDIDVYASTNPDSLIVRVHPGDLVKPEEHIEPEPSVSDVRAQAVRDIAAGMDVPEQVVTSPEPLGVVAGGGWCAPAGQEYGILPNIQVRRGGIQFTAPKPLTEWRKEDLRAEVERLRRVNDTLAQGNTEYRTENRRLRKKTKRLLKIIERIA